MEAATDIVIMESEGTENLSHAKHRGSDIGQDDLNEMMHETFAASGDKSSEAIDVPTEEEVRNPDAASDNTEKQKSDDGAAPGNEENNMTIAE
jgi:hypothetical protein